MERILNKQAVINRVKSLQMNTLRGNWRKTILIVCVVALGIDPLYLFVPVVDSPKFCFTFDKKLATGVSVLRTFIDVFYVVHIILNFMRYSNGELNLHAKPKRETYYFISYTIVDILSVLPMPQVLVLTLMRRSDSLVSREILKWIVLSQYIPRILRIYPLYKEVTKASGTVAETKWIGAAFNLFLYMLHSHVFGAFWYVSSVEKINKCWRLACPHLPGCSLKFQYCGREGGNNIPYGLNTSCPLIEPDQITNSSVFNFGMYIDALKSGIVEVKPDDFPRKFFYCFWWGLRNISALGQNLRTSNSVGDIVFALIICVSGLLLFAVLIGNIQKYLQSNTTRIDEMEERKRDTEIWMSSKSLPENLKDMIRRHEEEKWQKTRGIEEEAFLQSLPDHIRLHIERNSLNSRGNEEGGRRKQEVDGRRGEEEDMTRNDEGETHQRMA
ncbi:PREDICTED: probable cyclic nucleotide-gated ion channel 12 [Brassica oleracea var. oleracea]|uniref:probable cyclic nucleotide-gated ion channel 12 n=1 Tax=Brassica oleracea var. oleracea TaxID=109376 RepID=UPI0006A6D722|nr:PREDICTED: probable cyclic nucleotide-gated ion channel 12 [Brassica oleracea var. oleracea]